MFRAYKKMNSSRPGQVNFTFCAITVSGNLASCL